MDLTSVTVQPTDKSSGELVKCNERPAQEYMNLNLHRNLYLTYIYECLGYYFMKTLLSQFSMIVEYYSIQFTC